jgi:phage-related protein
LHYFKNPEFKWDVKVEKFPKILSDEDRKGIIEDREPDYIYIYICVKVNFSHINKIETNQGHRKKDGLACPRRELIS